jgi:hypothetical protein
MHSRRIEAPTLAQLAGETLKQNCRDKAQNNRLQHAISRGGKTAKTTLLAVHSARWCLHSAPQLIKAEARKRKHASKRGGRMHTSLQGCCSCCRHQYSQHRAAVVRIKGHKRCRACQKPRDPRPQRCRPVAPSMNTHCLVVSVRLPKPSSRADDCCHSMLHPMQQAHIPTLI